MPDESEPSKTTPSLRMETAKATDRLSDEAQKRLMERLNEGALKEGTNDLATLLIGMEEEMIAALTVISHCITIDRAVASFYPTHPFGATGQQSGLMIYQSLLEYFGSHLGLAVAGKEMESQGFKVPVEDNGTRDPSYV